MPNTPARSAISGLTITITCPVRHQSNSAFCCLKGSFGAKNSTIDSGFTKVGRPQGVLVAQRGSLIEFQQDLS